MTAAKSTPQKTNRGRNSVRAILAAVALAVFANASATSVAATNDAAKLTALDQAMQRAVVDRDAEAFGAFLANDYLLVTSSSRTYTKSDVVAGIAAPDSEMSVNDSSNLNIRVRGDTAIVIADLHQVGSQHGKPFDFWVRYTDTWIRAKNTWLCMSGHASRLQR